MVNRYPWIKLNADLMVARMYLMSCLHIGIAAIFCRSRPISILRMSNPTSELTKVTGLSSLPSSIHGRVRTPTSINCSRPFTAAVPLQRNRSIRRVAPSVTGLVHLLNVPYLCDWTGSFAECTHFVDAVYG